MSIKFKNLFLIKKSIIDKFKVNECHLVLYWW